VAAGSATHEAITSTWKVESARVVAVIARIVRDVGVAEELAQDALVAALEEWPRSGVPERPGAWLMTTAKNRALNAIRRTRLVKDKHEALVHELPSHLPLDEIEAALEAGMDEDIADDVLALMFIACHPLLTREARVALTLRLIGGLSTLEIARAFLVPEPTIAQRIVRAKRTLGEAGIAYEVPRKDEAGERLSSVLEVVYLVFNEGYSATAGDDLMRPALVAEAVRLGKLLAELAPQEAEVLSLLALMELQASRGLSRQDASGEPVLLLDQDRARWDGTLIASGLAHLTSAHAIDKRAGPYRLQADIAACHARARSGDETNWREIASLYAELLELVPSPIVELNHAVAVSRADGPEAGMLLLDALAVRGELARYPLLFAARADLLERLGRRHEASAEFERAATLTDNAIQKARLLARSRAQKQ
jgi:RNA polymerase sigma factor (sigma-70 family)